MPTTRIDRAFERRLAAFVNAGEVRALQGGQRGVEKESLRVTPQGHISATPHPAALGAALTHAHITTDYSEALLELVTPSFVASAYVWCSRLGLGNPNDRVSKRFEHHPGPTP